MAPPATSSLDLEAPPEKVTRFVRHVTVEAEDHGNPPAPAHATAEVAPRLTSEFRTLSIHVETRTSPADDDAGISGAVRHKTVKGTLSTQYIPRFSAYFSDFVDLVSLEWHTISVEEAVQRLNVSPQSGLDDSQVKRRQETSGKNVISPPKSNMLRKVLEWIFGGFGSLLLVASVFCFVSWYVSA